MVFQKGYAKIGGRKANGLNKITKAMKEANWLVYQGLGGHKAYLAWARENETEFRKIMARHIPVEVSGPEGGPIQVTRTVYELHPGEQPPKR